MLQFRKILKFLFKIFLIYTIFSEENKFVKSQNNPQQSNYIDISIIDEIQNKILIESKEQYEKILNETDLSYLEFYYSKNSNNSVIGAYQLRLIDRKLDYLSKILFIDCDEMDNSEFSSCMKKNENSKETFNYYPRIYMLVPNERKFDEKQNILPYKKIPYNKDNVSDKIMFEFISENIISFSVRLNKENIGFFLEATFFNKVILFTEKKNTPNVYRGISNYFYDRLLFGEVGSNEEEILKRFNVTKFPTIIAIENSFYTKESEKIHVYHGSMFASDITEFLKKFALKEKHYMVRMNDINSLRNEIDYLNKFDFDWFFEENKYRNKIIYFHEDENFNDFYTTPEAVKEIAQYSR